jgi:hypothetical protein
MPHHFYAICPIHFQQSTASIQELSLQVLDSFKVLFSKEYPTISHVSVSSSVFKSGLWSAHGLADGPCKEKTFLHRAFVAFLCWVPTVGESLNLFFVASENHGFL